MPQDHINDQGIPSQPHHTDYEVDNRDEDTADNDTRAGGGGAVGGGEACPATGGIALLQHCWRGEAESRSVHSRGRGEGRGSVLAGSVSNLELRGGEKEHWYWGHDS